MKEWLTIPEAAVLADRTTAAIYKWIQRGKLRAYPTTSGQIVRLQDIDALERSTPRQGGRPTRETPRA